MSEHTMSGQDGGQDGGQEMQAQGMMGADPGGTGGQGESGQGQERGQGQGQQGQGQGGGQYGGQGMPPPGMFSPQYGQYAPYAQFAQGGMPYMGAGYAMPGTMGAAPQGPGMAQAMQELANGGGLGSLTKLLDFSDKEFWKGAAVGAAVVLLLTNESVQRALFRKAGKGEKQGDEKTQGEPSAEAGDE